jgi:hypothetical protein
MIAQLNFGLSFIVHHGCGFDHTISLFFLFSFSFFFFFSSSEWIDFPRGEQRLSDGKVIPGNNNSFDKCRRRFDLVSFFWSMPIMGFRFL